MTKRKGHYGLGMVLALCLCACGKSPPANSPDEVVPLDDTTGGPATEQAATPSGPEVNQAIDAIEAKEFDRAKQLLTTALQKHPGDAQAEYYLGVALTGLGDKQGAIESFKRAITADPKLVDAYVNLSAAELDAGDAGAAFETANRGLKLAEQHPDLTLNRALALEALGKKDEALSAYGLAVRAAPKNLTLRLSYAQLLARANRRSEALSEIAAVRDSKDPRLLAVAANVARSLKAFADCLAVLDRALKLEDHPALHVRRGMCRQDSKDLAGAKSDFEQAIAMDDGFAPAHYYLGMTLRETDKKTACKELKRAAELGGDRGVGPEAKQAVSDLGCK